MRTVADLRALIEADRRRVVDAEKAEKARDALDAFGGNAKAWNPVWEPGGGLGEDDRRRAWDAAQYLMMACEILMPQIIVTAREMAKADIAAVQDLLERP